MAAGAGQRNPFSGQQFPIGLFRRENADAGADIWEIVVHLFEHSVVELLKTIDDGQQWMLLLCRQAGIVQTALKMEKHLIQFFQKSLTCRCQTHAIAGAGEQRCAHFFFQPADTAA